MENVEQTAQVQEQVETAAPTTAEETPATETQDVETGEHTEEQPAEVKPKKGIEKRFSELTARAKAAEQYAARLEHMLERFQQPAQPPQPEQPQGKPTREQFDYDEDRYLEALTDWKLQERLQRQQEESYKRQREVESHRRQQDYSTRVEKTNVAGMTKYGDYDAVVLENPELVVTNIMADAMTMTDVGADIAYHLGKHPQEAQRISQLPPQAQILEIGYLATKLKTPAPKRTTSAPPPIEAVGARGVAEFDPEKLSTKEWIKLRNEGKI